jgi:hypothetical protein
MNQPELEAKTEGANRRSVQPAGSAQRCHVCGKQTDNLETGYYTSGFAVLVMVCRTCAKDSRVTLTPNSKLSGGADNLPSKNL